MEIFKFLLPYFATGLACGLVSVLVERFMVRQGWTRGNTFVLAIVVFVSAVVLELVKFPSTVSLNILEFFFLFILAPLKANQTDIIRTLEEGSWWWKKENSS